VSRAGLLSFFHDYLRQAVENRYLSSNKKQQEWHLRLADFFDKQDVDNRVANELPWQLEQAGEKERLRSCISEIPMFLQFKGDKLYELWGYWLGLEPKKTMVGAYEESFAEYEETEKHTEKHLGYVLNQLGMFFEKAGYFSAAIPLLRRALEISEKVDLAKPFFKRVLAIIKKFLGKDDPETASSLNNLAGLLDSKGDYEAAEPLYRRALSIREKVLGAEHPDTALSMNNLAGLLVDSKRDYELAEQLYKRALAIDEKVLGACP